MSDDPDTIASLAATHGLPKDDRRIQVMAVRMAKLKALRIELAQQYSLTVEDPRIQQGALAKLNQGNWEAKILLGNPVPNIELQAYTNIVAQLLGEPPAKPFEISFVQTMSRCPSCGFKAPRTSDDEAWAAERNAKYNTPPAAAAEPAPETSPGDNVTPLKPKAPPPPLKPALDYAPAIDHAANELARQGRAPLTLEGRNLGELVANANVGPSGPTISLPPGQDFVGGYGRFDNKG